MNCIRTLFLTGALALAAAASALAQDSQLPIYLNTAYSFEERATDLVSRLTLEEKQSLLGNNMAAVRGAARRALRREPFRGHSRPVVFP